VFGAAGVVSLAAARRPFVSFVFFAIACVWLSAMVAGRRPAVARLVRGWFLVPGFDPSAHIDRVVFARVGVLMAALVLLIAPSWRNPPPLSPLYDDHEWTSLNIAITRAKCGAASAIPDVDIAAQLSSRPGDVRTPVLELAAFRCSSIRPFVISQNSLMLIEAATLRLNPRASLTTIARVLIAIQFLGTATFVTAMTVVGMPVLWSGLLILGVTTLTVALMEQYAYAVYPLNVPCVLGLIGIMTMAPRSGSWWLQVGIAVMIGIGIGAVGNLRTDMLLICVVLAAVWLLVTAGSRTSFAAQSIALATGVIAFNIVCIGPIERMQPNRLTGHPIMHPLVLALAVPDNALARQLYITWDDAVGFDLAHRIQPGVDVLTPQYEAVLRRFYFNLWRTHPREMLTVYRIKFSAAARSFVVDTTGIGFDGQLWRSVLRPLEMGNSSGWPVPALFALGACTGLLAIRRRPQSWVLPLTMVVIAGGLNWLEAVVIFSRFTPQYYSVAFIALVALCLSMYQLVWQLAWWPMNRSVLPPLDNAAQGRRESRGMNAL
jgi:hypothetical protein